VIPEMSYADQVTQIDSDPPLEVEYVKTFMVNSAPLLIFPSVALHSLFTQMFKVLTYYSPILQKIFTHIILLFDRTLDGTNNGYNAASVAKGRKRPQHHRFGPREVTHKPSQIGRL
jgi:hypothetical protein